EAGAKPCDASKHGIFPPFSLKCQSPKHDQLSATLFIHSWRQSTILFQRVPGLYVPWKWFKLPPWIQPSGTFICASSISGRFSRTIVFGEWTIYQESYRESNSFSISIEGPQIRSRHLVHITGFIC